MMIVNSTGLSTSWSGEPINEKMNLSSFDRKPVDRKIFMASSLAT
jgi:hypothetical protein